MLKSIVNRINVAFVLMMGLSFSACSQMPDGVEIVKKTIPVNDSIEEKKFVHSSDLYHECWDTLSQPQFWRRVMNLPPDSLIVNVAATREVLEVISFEEWDKNSEEDKDSLRAIIRECHCLDKDEKIYFTIGKSDYYRVDEVIPTINDALDVFEKNETDPWYAQVILLIESPGQIIKSSVGAYGPFQLMRHVAVDFGGLKVNKYNDERKDLKKSAYAASNYIKKVCVPKIKSLLDRRNIAYQETDLWFRLMVLHAYHAGPNNLAGVIAKIDPKEGGIALIRTIWKTEYRGFQNASQNYSQIALASVLNLDELLVEREAANSKMGYN